MTVGVNIKVQNLALDVPAFLQNDRATSGWGDLFFGAAFDPPKRRLLRLLDNLNFEIKEGDRLAILGRNGAGKSTLLRVLNRVYQPSAGSLEINGSCQALLNMSLGFSGEATVRENIFLRGVAMGLKAAFLRDQVGPILEFSGLHEKVNHRLRTLSSGQKMRLGFAISTAVQHDIMLMDEWVGAGDADFMRKAKERMLSRVGGSKIVVLASHSTGLLRELCNRAIVLERGAMVFAGDITSSLKYYHDLLARLRAGEQIETQLSTAGGGAQIFGAVEEISLKDGDCVVRGWFIDTEGMVPHGIALQSGAERYDANRIEHTRRPDVMRHFGLASDECGFVAHIEIAGISHLSELGEELQIFGGVSSEHAYAPLRLAPSVVVSLQAPFAC